MTSPILVAVVLTSLLVSACGTEVDVSAVADDQARDVVTLASDVAIEVGDVVAGSYIVAFRADPFGPRTFGSALAEYRTRFEPLAQR